MRRRRKYYKSGVSLILSLAKSGSLEKYSATKLEEYLSLADIYLKEAEAKLLNQQKRQKKAMLEKEIQAILDAGKLPQSYFYWGAQKLYTDDALSKANIVRAMIEEFGLPDDCSYLSSEHEEAKSNLQILRQVVFDLRKAIPIATARALRINEQRVGAHQRREASEKRKVERNQATKALAAAHLNNTRSLAATIKRGLSEQIALLPFCPYCQGTFDSGTHADHIYPVSKGGLSTHRNMVYVCSSCNVRKSSLTLLQFINASNLDATDIYRCLDLLEKDY